MKGEFCAMAIKYSAEKHTRAEIGNVMAQDYGEHIVSLDISAEENGIDNGRFVHVVKMTDLDKWSYEAVPADYKFKAYVVMQHPVSKLWLVQIDTVADDKLAFIYQKPLIAEESPRILTAESNFYNDPADGPVRGYIMHSLDRVWLSEEGFSGTPAAGKTITAFTDGKPVIGA
jgi:hypothetical protein